MFPDFFFLKNIAASFSMYDEGFIPAVENHSIINDTTHPFLQTIPQKKNLWNERTNIGVDDEFKKNLGVYKKSCFKTMKIM